VAKEREKKNTKCSGHWCTNPDCHKGDKCPGRKSTGAGLLQMDKASDRRCKIVYKKDVSGTYKPEVK